MSESYSIGQVLYLVSHKQNSLIPVQVQEITQKITIEGTDTAYVVMGPNNDKGPYVLSDLDVDIYTDPSEVERLLKRAANAGIDNMVSQAISVAVDQFGVDTQGIPKKSQPPELPKKAKAKKATEPPPIAGDPVEKTGNAKIDNVPQPAKIRSVTMPNGERVNAV